MDPGDLLFLISHELPNKLNPIGLWADLLHTALASHPELADQLGPLSELQRAQQQAALALRRLSLAGKLQFGLYRPSPSSFDLAEAACEAVDRVTPLKPNAGRVHCDVPEVPMLADRGLLTSAMECLLENALNHGRGVDVRLGAQVTSLGEQPAIAITVSDRGPGMLPERLNAMLVASQPTSPSARYRGGIGLYLVQAVAKAMGGTLVAHSSPGQGASFSLRVRTHNVQGL